MKKLTLFIFVFITAATFGQFKGDESKPINIQEGILSDNPVSSIFNFFNSNNFSMNHSFSMSYSAMGSNGIALGVYTNKIGYEFSDKLNFQLATSFVNSPYSTFGDSFNKSINGIYIESARLNYQPSEDFNMSLEFSNSPFGYYNRYSPYRRGFYRDRFFWND